MNKYSLLVESWINGNISDCKKKVKYWSKKNILRLVYEFFQYGYTIEFGFFEVCKMIEIDI